MTARALTIIAALALGAHGAGCATSATAQSTAALSGRAYRVRVHRPVTVGTRYRIEGRGEMRRRSEVIDSFGRRIGGEESMASAEFIGHATVRAVDGEGYASEIEVEVRRAVADDGERSGPFIAPGSTLVIRAGTGEQEPVVEREGRAIDRFSYTFLELAFDLRSLYGARAGFFGPSRRRRVGERWPVPSLSTVTVSSATTTVTREDGTRETVRAAPRATQDGSSAEATLARVVTVDGVSCLEVRTTLRSDTRREDGAMGAVQTHEWTMLVPRARSRAPLGMSTRNSIDRWTVTAIDGRPARDHLAGERSTVVRFSPIDDAAAQAANSAR